MLKLSKKTDYALMAVQYMASKGTARIVNTKEIAEEYNIPVELLAKVLQKLGKKGLIFSQNGPKGGYLLAKSSTDISVLSVIQAIEGHVGITECYQTRTPTACRCHAVISAHPSATSKTASMASSTVCR